MLYLLDEECQKEEPSIPGKYLEHTLFSAFSSANFYSSIRPRRSQGDPKVVDLSQLKYDDDEVSYKLEHTDGGWILYFLNECKMWTSMSH